MSRVIHTGLPLPSHKQHSHAAAIMLLPAPDTLLLPLDQHSDGVLKPCVDVNDRVFKGQIIAAPATDTDNTLSACLHAPVSGRVLAIEQPDSRSRNHTTAACIVIENDHLDMPSNNCRPTLDWLQLQPPQLCALIARGGIAGLGGAVFPTATKLAAHAHSPIDTLLLNGVECEPFITCDDRLMRERAAQILSGAQILLHAAQAKQCLIAIESDKPEALAAMQAALSTLNDPRMTLRSITTAYPSGDEGQLIRLLLDREIPRAGLPAHIGVIVQNVATAYACARWVLEGEPLISRIVTVTGPGIHTPANLEVRLGTPIGAVVAACGGYRDAVNGSLSIDTLIMGGAMMGRTLAHDQLPIVKASNCLIIGNHAALRAPAPELPCIRCGECAEACPVHLLPQQLLAYARSRQHHALQQLGLADCIECGCCDFVCPSNITLAATFHAAKRQTGH